MCSVNPTPECAWLLQISLSIYVSGKIRTDSRIDIQNILPSLHVKRILKTLLQILVWYLDVTGLYMEGRIVHLQRAHSTIQRQSQDVRMQSESLRTACVSLFGYFFWHLETMSLFWFIVIPSYQYWAILITPQSPAIVMVCSEPGGQQQVLPLSLDAIVQVTRCYRLWWSAMSHMSHLTDAIG